MTSQSTGQTRLWLSLAILLTAVGPLAAAEPVNFVMQLTRAGDNFGHRRALLQIDRALSDLGTDSIKITVVAYEEGIQALRSDNEETSQLLAALARRGVSFKACRISMRAWKLKEEDFPLEVDFVPAGAPEVLRLQMKGYRYWRP